MMTNPSGLVPDAKHLKISLSRPYCCCEQLVYLVSTMCLKSGKILILIDSS